MVLPLWSNGECQAFAMFTLQEGGLLQQQLQAEGLARVPQERMHPGRQS